MATKKENTITPAANEIDAPPRRVAVQASEPRDVVAALALRKTIADFTAGSQARTALSAEDNQLLDAATAKLVDLDAAATAGLPGTYVRQAAALTTAIYSFVRTNRGTETRTVADVSFEVSALKTEEIRGHLARVGAEIVALLDAYVAERRNGIARQLETDRRNDEILVRARKMPIVGAAIQLYEESYTLSRTEPGSSWGITTGMLEGASRAMDCGLAMPGHAGQIGESVSGYDLRATIERQVKARIAAAA